MAFPTPTPQARCVVTGASSGIGKAIARELADRGFGLILVARSTEILEALQSELGTRVDVDVRSCDLSDAAQRAELIAELREREIDLIVNSAGIATFGDFIDLDYDYERAQFELNATAVFELTAAVIPGMVKRGCGSIINVGSAAGNMPIPGNATYVGTKAMVNTFTEALHYELAPRGVHCTLLAPGPVREAEIAPEDETMVDRAVPDFLWTTYDGCAVDTLEAAKRNKVRVVPGGLSKAMDKASLFFSRKLSAPVMGMFYKRIAQEEADKKQSE